MNVVLNDNKIQRLARNRLTNERIKILACSFYHYSQNERACFGIHLGKITGILPEETVFNDLSAGNKMRRYRMRLEKHGFITCVDRKYSHLKHISMKWRPNREAIVSYYGKDLVDIYGKLLRDSLRKTEKNHCPIQYDQNGVEE